MRQFVTWSVFAASVGLFFWSFVPTSWLSSTEQVDTPNRVASTHDEPEHGTEFENPPGTQSSKRVENEQQQSREARDTTRSNFDRKAVLGPAPALLSSDNWSVQKPKVPTDDSGLTSDRSSISIPEEPPAWMTKPLPKAEEKSYAETHPTLPREFKPISSNSGLTPRQDNASVAKSELGSSSPSSGIRSIARSPQTPLRSTAGWHGISAMVDQRTTAGNANNESPVVNAGWQPGRTKISNSSNDPEIRQAAFYQSQPPASLGAGPPVGGSTVPSFPSGSASPSFGSPPAMTGQPGTFPPPPGTSRIDPPATGLEPRVMPPGSTSGNTPASIMPQNNGSLITPINPSMPSYSQPLNPQQANGPRYVTGEPFVSGPPRQWELQYIDYNRGSDPCQPGRGAAAGHSVPGVITPPTLTPNQTPAIYSPNNAGFRPLFTLGQENYNVQLGRGLYGQPTAYVPGQNIRNFFRYLFP